MTHLQPILSQKQIAALTELLAGHTIEASAAAIKVAPSTLHRWLRDPAFLAELAALRRMALREALDVLTASAREAAETIRVLIQDDTIAPAIRLRAAEAVLDRLTQWAELDDIAARLTALEEANRNEAT